MTYRTPRLFASLATAAALSACNPLAYGELLDGAHVKHFDLSPPVSGKPWGPVALRVVSPDGASDGHMLMAGETVPVLTDLRLSPIGDAIANFAGTDDLQNLMFPISELDKTSIGGLAQVPSPTMDGELTFLASFTSTEIGVDSRVVRFRGDFSRTDMADFDISEPFIGGVKPNDFGAGLAAINLEPGAPDNDPMVEVAVGSDQGVFIFDSVGLNTEGYLATRATIVQMNPTAFAGPNEPEGRHFTFCENLAGFHDLTAGNLGPGNTPVFVASQDATINLIADQGVTNQIGAPVYDCLAREIAITPPSATYGAELFVDDFDDDGNDDLFVGDPGTNRVDVFVNGGSGLPSAPTFSIEPGDDAVDFGYSIGRADLTGGFGSAIVVGAPATASGLDLEVGRVYVYRIFPENKTVDVMAPIVLDDLQPQAGSRHGLWVGGVYNAEVARDELVVIGNLEGRVHLAVEETDPRP